MYEGLSIDSSYEDKFKFYWRYTKTNEFLCLQLGTKFGTENYGLYLSEIYLKEYISIIDKYIESNKFKFKDTILKIINLLKIDFYLQNL
jgi:hypothetical protein